LVEVCGIAPGALVLGTTAAATLGAFDGVVVRGAALTGAAVVGLLFGGGLDRPATLVVGAAVTRLIATEVATRDIYTCHRQSACASAHVRRRRRAHRMEGGVWEFELVGNARSAIRSNSDANLPCMYAHTIHRTLL
jgi:hypothetical protein